MSTGGEKDCEARVVPCRPGLLQPQQLPTSMPGASVFCGYRERIATSQQHKANERNRAAPVALAQVCAAANSAVGANSAAAPSRWRLDSEAESRVMEDAWNVRLEASTATCSLRVWTL